MFNDWNGYCHRCKKETNVHTMSRFNTQLICDDCEIEETKHPDYEYARKVEFDACRAGNLNFSGVGWPGKNGRLGR